MADRATKRLEAREGRPVRRPHRAVAGRGRGPGEVAGEPPRAPPGAARPPPAAAGGGDGEAAERRPMSEEPREDATPGRARCRPPGDDPGARPHRAARPRQGARRAGRRVRAARTATLRRVGRPLGDWTTRPRILVTNDDGIESRGLLALKQALDPIGEVTVVAPDTNQSAVGHQKTLMRPLRVRERTLADGSTGYSIDGSPTDCVSLAFLGLLRRARSTSSRRASTTARTWATTSRTRAPSRRRWRR